MDYDFERNENFSYTWFTPLTGLSFYRYMMHGKSDVQIRKLIVHLYPEIYYPEDKPHLLVLMR